MSTQSIDEKFKLPKRFGGSAQSVWNEYTQLSIEYRPLSLAHGFSDYHVPKYITDALAAATKDSDCLLNQYASGYVSSYSTSML